MAEQAFGALAVLRKLAVAYLDLGSVVDGSPAILVHTFNQTARRNMVHGKESSPGNSNYGARVAAAVEGGGTATKAAARPGHCFRLRALQHLLEWEKDVTDGHGESPCGMAQPLLRLARTHMSTFRRTWRRHGLCSIDFGGTR